MHRRTLFASAFALVLAAGVYPTLFSTPCFALDELRIIAPASPGGGWDQTARVMQQVQVMPRQVQVDAVRERARAEVGRVVGLAVERHERVELPRLLGNRGHERGLLAVVPREILAEHEVLPVPVHRPGEEHGARGEATGLEVEEKRPVEPEMPERGQLDLAAGRLREPAPRRPAAGAWAAPLAAYFGNRGAGAPPLLLAEGARALGRAPLPDAELIARTYGWVLPIAPGSLHDWEIPALAHRVIPTWPRTNA